MGIQGLTSFVDKKFKRWEKKEIRGKIIIDGSSLMFTLYTFDWGHGGQYPEFRSKIQGFFQATKASGITPIVVMDGVDVEGRKMPVIMSRRRERIKKVDRYCRQERRESVIGLGVLPPLVLQVYLRTLQELGVELTFADGEGDIAVFELANGYSCPVLSNDSDFLMYNLHSGYIPLNQFKWEESMPIVARVYHHVNFCTEFGLHDPNLRLVIPAIAGNDFISSIDDENFAGYLARNSPELNYRHDKIGTIVNFIQKFPSLEGFKGRIVSFPCLTRNGKEKLIENCRQAEKMYNSDETSSLDLMREKSSLRLHSSSKNIPKWLLNQYRSGNLFTMHILATSRHILNVFVEDTFRSSCTVSSKPIRQFIYGIMGLPKVTECGRIGSAPEEVEVEASTDLVGGRRVPQLQRIPTISASERAHVVYSVLGCSNTEPMLDRLDKQWRLAIAATEFWVRECSPDQLAVEALVLCFTVLSTNIDTLKRLNLSVHEHFRRSQQWMDLLHVFSQWQSCYGDALRLNQILMLPLKPVSPASIFDGRLLIYVASSAHNKRVVTDLQDIKTMRLYSKLVDIASQPRKKMGYDQTMQTRSSQFKDDGVAGKTSSAAVMDKDERHFPKATASGQSTPSSAKSVSRSCRQGDTHQLSGEKHASTPPCSFDKRPTSRYAGKGCSAKDRVKRDVPKGQGTAPHESSRRCPPPSGRGRGRLIKSQESSGPKPPGQGDQLSLASPLQDHQDFVKALASSSNSHQRNRGGHSGSSQGITTRCSSSSTSQEKGRPTDQGQEKIQTKRVDEHHASRRQGGRKHT